MPALTFVGRLMPAENTYDWTLRNRETKRAASARYSSRAPIRVSHLVLARARARARSIELFVKCVPLRLSVRDTFRSSRSPYVIGNGGGFSSFVHDCVRSLAIIAPMTVRIGSPRGEI